MKKFHLRDDVSFVVRTVAFVAFAGSCASNLAAQSSPRLFRSFVENVPDGAQLKSLGDFDGDGDADGLGVDTVGVRRLFWNDGHGRFTAGPVVPFEVLPTASADWNGDGHVDALGADLGGVLCAYVGDGFGGFSCFGSPWTAPSAAPPDADLVVVADIDGDGRSDVFGSVGRQSIPSGFLLRSNGAGFDDWLKLPGLAGVWVTSVLGAGRRDGDGSPDLLLSTYDPAGLHVYRFALKTSAGYALQPALDVVPFDVPAGAVFNYDGDGSADAALLRYAGVMPALCLEMAVFPGLGGPSIPMDPGGTEVVFASIVPIDLDRDGLEELAIGPRHGLFGIYQAQAGLIDPAAPPQVGAAPSAFRSFRTESPPFCGDLDADGDVDLAFLESDGTFGARLAASGVPGGVPFAWNQAEEGASPNMFAQVDGDGFSDRLILTSNPSASMLDVAFNDRYGGFVPPSAETTSVLSSSGPWGYALFPTAVLDVDGDGGDEVFVAGVALGPGQGEADLLWRRNAAGVWQETQFPVVGSSDFRPLVRDMNDDGVADLVYSTGAMVGMRLVEGGSLGGFVAAGPHAARSIVAGDFDGDGDGDIAAVASYVTAPPTGSLWYEHTPNGFLQHLLPISSAALVASADFNGDGRDDIAADQQVWFGGPGGFVAGPAGAPGMPPYSTWTDFRLAADVDGDGLADLLDIFGYARGQGGGWFGPREEYFGALQVPLAGASFQLMDIDRDGDADLVPDLGPVLRNSSRQLAPGLRARLGRDTSLVLSGPSGEPYSLFASSSPASPQFMLPGFGVVAVDPNGAVLAATGVFGTDGMTEIVGSVPASPVFVGTTLYWQAVLPSVPALTGGVRSTIAQE